MNTSLTALNAVNFFMADVRDGLGPYLGVYLQQKNWSPSEIGVVMTIGGLAAMAATIPLGALVDRLQAKRLLMVIAAVATVIASVATYYSDSFMLTGAAQAASGIAGAIIPPAIAGITLGLVHQHGFNKQMGRNEAFNHGGNVAAALACGGLGYAFGLGAVFIVLSAMAVVSLMALAFIDPNKIDYRAARGAARRGAKVQAFSVLLTSKPLLVLSLTLLLFHLSNAAMLPLLGQSLSASGAGDPSAYTSATIIIAQLSMIPMALLAAWLADNRGYRLVFILALIALPVRGAIAATVTGPIGLLPVQVLDGVGAGLLGVAVPGLVARIMAGSGRVNAALGVVTAFMGVGAALSPAIGGAVAEKAGYAWSFGVLGIIAVVALAVWLAATPIVHEACAASPARSARRR